MGRRKVTMPLSKKMKKKGQRYYNGYISPAPGTLSKKYRDILGKAYASCRKKNPGELKKNKTKCARIAWDVVKNTKNKKGLL